MLVVGGAGLGGEVAGAVQVRLVQLGLLLVAAMAGDDVELLVELAPDGVETA